MIPTLTVTDPLAGQAITIVITLAAADGTRDDRPAMISIGAAGQPPLIQTGTWADVPHLIDQAWTTIGLRAQMAVPEEETVVATADTDEGTTPPPLSPPQNLSLF